MNDRHTPTRPAALTKIDLDLAPGARLGPFEVQRLIARGGSSFVYLATDRALAMPVALQEYLPMHLVFRDAWLHLHASDAWHEEVLSRGMQIFIEESRLLARCDHPALVRVNHLFEANGTAYRVMPFQPGQRLSEVRRAMSEVPAEGPLRALLGPLLGALETIHQLDQVHGGVSATNILLIDDDFPLLLSPGKATREIRSDLVESLMVAVESQPGALLPDASPTGASIDLCALAEVMRFCITGITPGAARPREPLSALIARQPEGPAWPVYSPEFLSTLDAATSTSPEDWPASVAQFRLWLVHGTPAQRAAGRAVALLQPAAFEATDAANPDALDFGAYDPASSAEPIFLPMSPTRRGMATEQASAPDETEEVPLARKPARLKRWHGMALKVLFGCVLAASAAGIIAWVTGAWTVMPAISLDRGVASPLARVEERPAVEEQTSSPPPESAIERPEPSARVDKVPPSPVPAAATPVLPASPGAPADSTPAPPLESPTAQTEPDLDPAHALALHPPGAGRSAPGTARVTKHKTGAPASTARSPADPRGACAGRSEFALYRCMVQQCEKVKWTAHPQCVRLQLHDRVD